MKAKKSKTTKQCPFVLFRDPDSQSMAFTNCKHDESHDGLHEDWYHATDGYWVKGEFVYQEKKQ